jgi:hypothetical protein
MARNEDIMEAAFQRFKSMCDLPEMIKRAEDFVEGAKYADEHPIKSKSTEVWFVRDKFGGLSLHSEKPEEVFRSAGQTLDSDLFPEVTYENSPVKATLSINLE